MDDPLDLKARLCGLDLPQRLRVLDLCCGTRSSRISEQLRALPFQLLVGIDRVEAYLDAVRAVPHAALRTDYLRLDVRKAAKRFPPGHFDVVLLLDGLEHLKKRHGEALLRDLEKIVLRRIVLWLPLGDTVGYYSLQAGADRKAKRLETHRSAWYEPDLTRLGYRVQVYPAFHRHLSPPADAAWAVKDL